MKLSPMPPPHALEGRLAVCRQKTLSVDTAPILVHISPYFVSVTVIRSHTHTSITLLVYERYLVTAILSYTLLSL